MPDFDYAQFDADDHYYGPPDCFTRYIEPKHRDKAIELKPVEGVAAAVFVGDRPFTFLTGGFAGETVSSKMYANIHAFNRWLLDDWGFNYKDRIYAPPLLSLLDLDRAVEELEWVLEQGARIISLRPGPAFGRSPADPYFDPFWSILNEARVPVAFHIAESGYNEIMSVHWGEQPNPSSHRQSAFQWNCCYGDRVIIDTMASLIFNNLFGRFPNLSMVSVENGSLWVSYAMKAMDKMKGMGRNGPWPGGYVKGRPCEVLKQHVLVSPYHEEDIESLIETIGVSQVLFGSDYPHPEGLAESKEFAAAMPSLSPEELRMAMQENARGLIHLGAVAS